MNEHTPGPWYTEAICLNSWDITEPSREEPIAAVMAAGDADMTAEDEANAHLIAAAPDLYAAGKDILEACNQILHVAGRNKLQFYRRALHAAIAKAEGETP